MKPKPLIDNPWFPQPSIPWDSNDPNRQGLWGYFVGEIVWPIAMMGCFVTMAHAFPASLVNLWNKALLKSPQDIALALLLMVLAVPTTLFAGESLLLSAADVVAVSRYFRYRV